MTWPAPSDVGTAMCAQCATQDATVSTWLDYYRQLVIARKEA
jgi:hypothetical protein